MGQGTGLSPRREDPALMSSEGIGCATLLLTPVLQIVQQAVLSFRSFCLWYLVLSPTPSRMTYPVRAEERM
jgi:hypothetical protein